MAAIDEAAGSRLAMELEFDKPASSARKGGQDKTGGQEQRRRNVRTSGHLCPQRLRSSSIALYSRPYTNSRRQRFARAGPLLTSSSRKAVELSQNAGQARLRTRRITENAGRLCLFSFECQASKAHEVQKATG